MGIRKEGMRDQAGEKEESRRSESRNGAPGKPLRGETGKSGKEEQRAE